MKMSLRNILNIFLNIYNKYKKNKVFIMFLYLFLFIYLIAYKFRELLYDLNLLKKYSIPAYVISIGNITCGGTGKTPFTIETAKYYMSLGYKVAIISRGYMAKIKNVNNVVLVSDGNELLTEYEICGDEAYLIAKKIPKCIVLVSKNRIEGCKSAIKLGAEIILLDDGYQYLKLNRNKNILLLDSYKPFDNGYLLPLGKLRELPNSIKRATGIILTNTDRKTINEKDLLTINKHKKNIPVYKIGYQVQELISLNTKQILNINSLKGTKTIAFSGIGNPESFIELLQRHQINVVDNISFSDHYNYGYNDILRVIETAQKHKIENIITTEKDAVKIEELCQAAPATFWYTKLEVTWDSFDMFEKLFTEDKNLK